MGMASLQLSSVLESLEVKSQHVIAGTKNGLDFRLLPCVSCAAFINASNIIQASVRNIALSRHRHCSKERLACMSWSSDPSKLPWSRLKSALSAIKVVLETR